MELNKHFVKYYSKLREESMLKSLIWSLVIGCTLGFIMALVAWFVNFGGLWGTILSVMVTVVTTAAAFPVFYQKVFKPNTLSSARRLDRYGLDERLITMVELENDNSYLAKLQREDAAKVLNTVALSDIKIRIPKMFIVTVSIIAAAFVCMTTVTGLAEAGIIKTGSEIWNDVFPEPKVKTFEVIYISTGGGYISGGDFQVVEKGKNAEQVVAVAEDGYMFAGWSDGSDRPSRIDVNINYDIVYEASFQPIGEGQGDGDGEGQGEGEAGDKPGKKPSKDKGDGQGKESNPSHNPSQGAAGQTDAGNQVIDGQKWYGTMIGDSYNSWLEDTNFAELPSDYVGFTEGYYGLMGTENQEEGDGTGGV